MQLKERYENNFRYWQDKNDAGWQDWFNPDIPGDLAYPAETEFAEDIIAQMLEAGETLWHHPGWMRDLWRLMGEWAEQDKLIRIRLYAQWLLTTIPSQPIDIHIASQLTQLATGNFSTLHQPRPIPSLP